jgi:hypothetical protein
MPSFRSALTLLLALPALAPAATTIEFTVSAGKVDRKNEVVRVPLELPSGTKVLSRVEIKDQTKRVVAAGQLTPPGLGRDSKAAKGKERFDLYFVLPELAAGKSATFEAAVGAPGASKDGFSWHLTDDAPWTDLRLGDRPVLRYVHPKLDESSKEKREETFKVFHHVFDPTGKRLVTKGVGGKYTHHRGLFYGFMTTTYGKDKVDIWHCKNDTHQAHQELVDAATGEVLGRHLVAVDWNGTGKKTFAKELRELTAYNVPGGTLIEFASLLTPTDEPVKLDGDPQHAGFHFRADNEVAEKTEKQTIFIRPDGRDKPGASRNWDAKKGPKTHKDLPWLAMSFVLGGKRYTACYLDRPDNPKEARYSERPYGRFGSYFVTTVTKEKPLLVRYRIWLQEGQMSVEEVAARSKAFVEPAEVKLGKALKSDAAPAIKP